MQLWDLVAVGCLVVAGHSELGWCLDQKRRGTGIGQQCLLLLGGTYGASIRCQTWRLQMQAIAFHECVRACT